MEINCGPRGALALFKGHSWQQPPLLFYFARRMQSSSTENTDTEAGQDGATCPMSRGARCLRRRRRDVPESFGVQVKEGRGGLMLCSTVKA